MIEQLLHRCGLGKPLSAPVPLSGGFLHKVERVETTQGIFVVKTLNPDIMRRADALHNMRLSEVVHTAFDKPHTAFDVCASLGGVVEMAGAFFIVYPWAEGRSVYPPEITAAHCAAMGHVLGSIHAAHIAVEGMPLPAQPRAPFDWADCGDPLIPQWDAACVSAHARLMDVQVISHRDLDPKNVLWHNLHPCVIDWEAAGYINPWQELVTLLNDWADDEPKARAMIAAYCQHIDARGADWEAAIAASMDGMLGWLHYQLHQPQGAEQVLFALDALHRCAKRAPELRAWLEM